MFRLKYFSTVSQPITNQINKPAVGISHNMQNVNDQFINLLMKDGKKAKATALIHETLKVLKSSFPNESPTDLLNKAVAKASPLLKLVSQKKGSKSVQLPTPLTLRQQRRFGIMWIIQGAQKRQITDKKLKYTFGTRLAQEVIGVLQGSCFSIDKKRELYKHALMNKANIVMNPLVKK